MPELPEVETLRRSLEHDLVGRTVARVDIRRRDVVVAPGDPEGGFSRSRSDRPPVRIKPPWMLRGLTIARLTRRGKQMAVEADTDRGAPALVIQLGMTGTVRSLDDRIRYPAHTHVVWTLENGRRFAFIDPRRFGGVRALPGGTRDAWAALGPDALTVRGDEFTARLARTRRAVKAALLDQAVVAGVGNIYADEALFASKIHPETIAAGIPRDAAIRLASNIRRILRDAIGRGGSTIKDYRNSDGEPGGFQAAHQVYGRGGRPCPRCGTILTPSRVAQRATVACGSCQAREPA